MKTNANTQKLRRMLVGLLLISLFSVASLGQTYKLLKAGNDPSGAKNLDEVSAVLEADDLSRFRLLTVSSRLIGTHLGQEFTLCKVPGMCLRAHSDIPSFVENGDKWLTTNPNIEMVVLDVKKSKDLDKLAETTALLIKYPQVRYVVVQTFSELYPLAQPQEYESKGLALVQPAAIGYLNTLFDRHIRFFFTAINFK